MNVNDGMGCIKLVTLVFNVKVYLLRKCRILEYEYYDIQCRCVFFINGLCGYWKEFSSLFDLY